LDRPFYGGSNDGTPFNGIGFFRRLIRGPECVGCSDLIVVLVLDGMDASVLAIAFLLCRPFVRGK
jgi:hypothetical protein